MNEFAGAIVYWSGVLVFLLILVTLRFGQRGRLRVCVFVIGLKVYCGIDQFSVLEEI